VFILLIYHFASIPLTIQHACIHLFIPIVPEFIAIYGVEFPLANPLYNLRCGPSGSKFIVNSPP
jgi:hypothetical protein